MRFHILACDDSCEHVLYENPDFEIEPGVTVLVGCNGAGKTTLVRRIRKALEADGAPVYCHEQTKARGRLDARLAFGVSGEEFANVLASRWQSEGEGHVHDLGNLLPEMGRFVMANPTEHPERWLLLDGLESGLSIDAADDIRGLIETIEGNVPDGITLYLVISTNAYELAREYDCIDVQTGRHRTFKTYDSYAKFIRRSREKKEHRKDLSERAWRTKYRNDSSHIVRDPTDATDGQGEREGQE